MYNGHISCCTSLAPFLSKQNVDTHRATCNRTVVFCAIFQFHVPLAEGVCEWKCISKVNLAAGEVKKEAKEALDLVSQPQRIPPRDKLTVHGLELKVRVYRLGPYALKALEPTTLKPNPQIMTMKLWVVPHDSACP